MGGCAKADYPPTPGTCENRHVSEFYSPDRLYKAVRFIRRCGYDYPAYHVSVLKAEASLPNAQGNVLVQKPPTDGKARAERIEMTWKESRLLRIAHNPEMELIRREPAYEEVGVEHADTFEAE